MGGRIGSIVVFVVVIGALNGLSYMFDWGWVFY